MTRRGADRLTTSASLLTDHKLLSGAVAVRLHITGVVGGKHVDQTGVAIYQVKGNTLSGVYTYAGAGSPPAQAMRIGLHAAEESAGNLGGGPLAA